MKKMPSVKAVVSLTVICLVTAIVLACVNYVTAPIIEKAEADKENAALRQVLPTGEEFEALDPRELSLDERITAVYRESAGEGYVFKMSVNGYKSGMMVICGIGSDGRVDGALCLSSSETLGKEKIYGEAFADVSLSDIDSVDTVSGATMTTSAYRQAVKLALEAFDTVEKNK